MADLASSMSNFLFPGEFRPLDGCDEEELNLESFIVSSSALYDSKESAIKMPTVSFHEPLENRHAVPEIGHEVAVEMEPEVTPSTPCKPPTHLPCLSPLTPTANLKVLISAASPEIRVLDSRRQLALFNVVADRAASSSSPLREEPVVDSGLGDMHEDVVEIECMSQGEDGMDDAEKPINRKSKSLGLLCQRFLSRYPDYPENGVAMAISLDAISKDLGVERRRIYDIVNVLESIEMVSRMAKNKYLWHGKLNMELTLARLKCLGEKKRYADQIAHLKKLQIQSEFRDELEQLSKQPFRDISNIGSQSHNTDGKTDTKDTFDEDINSRRDKSLGVMSQKFIMLFLVSQAKVITLDIAARVLIDDINYEIREGSKFKTKVRRLYDIANILTSLEMIKKVHVQEGRGRKPAFRWIGPNPDTRHVDPSDFRVENDGPSRQSFFSTPAAPRSSLPDQDPRPASSPVPSPRGPKRVAWSRHASFNAICEVVERERRSYSSAPNSPTKDGRKDKSLDNPIDEKFRQDFEALRSKYPDQMSQIYVGNKQEEHGQGDAGAHGNGCPVPSPACTPGHTAGVAPLNPKVLVSPIPGSLPMMGTSRPVSSPVPAPLSFSVAKSDGGWEAVASPGQGSVPSSSESKAVLRASATTTNGSGQYSMLTDAVNSLHVVLRRPDTTRRSKRTVRQLASGEFEYQPVVKRRRMETEEDLALQHNRRRDLPSQNPPPAESRYLKIPVDAKLLQQAPGRPMQTIIIRKDVSVLNNNSSLPAGVSTADRSGPPRGPVAATLVPGTIISGRQAPRPAILVKHVVTAPAKTVTVTTTHHSHGAAPSVPQTATDGPNSEHAPGLLCTERLSDGEEITRLPFHGVASEQTVQSGKQLLKQTQGDKGLRFDKVRNGQAGSQSDACTKTNGSAEDRMSPWQRRHRSRKRTVERFKKPSSARALHLCPEFRNADVPNQSTHRPHSPEIAAEHSYPNSAMSQTESNEDGGGGLDNGRNMFTVDETALSGLGAAAGRHDDLLKECKTACDKPGLGRNGFGSNRDREETLAWPLHNSAAETSEQNVPVKRAEPSQNSRPSRWQNSSKSLPCSPFLTLDGGKRPLPPGSAADRPRSVSSLGSAGMEMPSFGSPRVYGGDDLSLSSVLVPEGIRPGFPPLMMPSPAYLSPIQDGRHPSPSWKSSNSPSSQFSCFPPFLPACETGGLHNLSHSPVDLVSCGGHSVQASRDHASGLGLRGESLSPCRASYPTLGSLPNAAPRNPHTLGMSGPGLSQQLSGSSFRPISHGGDLWHLRRDRCLTSPTIPRALDLGSLVPQSSSTPSDTGTPFYMGYPCSQSTPVTFHRLPSCSLVPSAMRVTSQSLQYVSHSPSVTMFAPASISGNSMVCMSNPSVL